MSNAARVAIGMSWALTIAAGSAPIWWDQRPNGAALTLVFLFTAVMTFLYVMGYHAYGRQREGEKWSSNVVIATYWPAIRTSLWQQVAVHLLTALLLDCGEMHHRALVATIGYWLILSVIILRRPTTPTKTDLFLIKFGFLFLFLIVVRLAPVFWAGH
jgi:hypothetical protein